MHVELQRQWWYMCIAMDPCESDSSQLEYDLKMRDAPVSNRSRSRVDKVAVHNYLREYVGVIHLFDTKGYGNGIDFHIVYLMVRSNQNLTARDFGKRRNYEMFFWVESKRERIRTQRHSSMEFVPISIIKGQYQRVPEEKYDTGPKTLVRRLNAAQHITDKRIPKWIEAVRYHCGAGNQIQRDCKTGWPKHGFCFGAQEAIQRDCPKRRIELVKLPKNVKVNLVQEQSDSPTLPAL